MESNDISETKKIKVKLTDLTNFAPDIHKITNVKLQFHQKEDSDGIHVIGAVFSYLTSFIRDNNVTLASNWYTYLQST